MKAGLCLASTTYLPQGTSVVRWFMTSTPSEKHLPREPSRQCAKNRQRSLEKRRMIDQRKRQTLAEACMAGNQKSCVELQRLTESTNTEQRADTGQSITGGSERNPESMRQSAHVFS